MPVGKPRGDWMLNERMKDAFGSANCPIREHVYLRLGLQGSSRARARDTVDDEHQGCRGEILK